MNTYIISECGINANGDVHTAKRQIDLSKIAGASAVKFQIYDTDRLFTKNFKYYTDSKRGMFTYSQHKLLSEYAKEVGIEWFASPFHLDAIDLMESIGVKRYKVASRSIFDLTLLEKIAKTKKPVIMSCGMGRPEDIDRAFETLYSGGQITLLYCVCNYPTDVKDINFDVMIRLKKKYRVPVGFSSHCPNIDLALKAIYHGASVLEYHTTIDKTMPGCDQSSSIEYTELFELVNKVRKFEREHEYIARA